MKGLVLITLLSFSVALNSQVFDGRELNELNLKVQQGQFDDRDRGIAGSRYFEESFKKGSVLTADGVWYHDVELRYDAYADVVETKINGELFILPAGDMMQKAVIEKDTLVSLEYEGENKNFYLLHAGNLSLYVKKEIVFNEAIEAKGYQEPSPAQYEEIDPEFFWKKQNAKMQKVGGKKEVVAYLQEIDAETYIKQEKIRLKKVDGLLKLVCYYNEKQ